MAKDFVKMNSEAGREYILSLAKKLFASEYHDEKRLGLRLLQFYPHCLDLSVMPLLEEMLMRSPTWDLVDDISIHLVGDSSWKRQEGVSLSEEVEQVRELLDEEGVPYFADTPFPEGEGRHSTLLYVC